jgi:hypothetical protein
VSAAAVGALLAGRRPRHPVGSLLLGVGLGLAANILVEQYAKYGLLVRHGSLGLGYAALMLGLGGLLGRDTPWWSPPPP